MGLVREPAVAAPPAPEARPAVARPPAPPAARHPSPTAAPPPGYAPPDDPVGNPARDQWSSAKDLAALADCIQGCLACALGPGRFRFVFGEGDPKARLMFIGEGPGKDEDQQGRPFVGKAGELLDKMIGGIGLRRDQVYIANVVKCRPPDNRTPTPQEAQTCLGYLKRQIELIDPSVIVTLGATPLRELLGVATGITKVRGTWQRLELHRAIPVMPTFHPAYVLRQYTNEVRGAVWADLKAVRAWLDAHP
ncbi:MAG: uracil-DNA glycosylase [Holophagaceae bacterium]|nr:uracil-DNA glycosylase [Holophagaceae bacterium]